MATYSDLHIFMNANITACVTVHVDLHSLHISHKIAYKRQAMALIFTIYPNDISHLDPKLVMVLVLHNTKIRSISLSGTLDHPAEQLQQASGTHPLYASKECGYIALTYSLLGTHISTNRETD